MPNYSERFTPTLSDTVKEIAAKVGKGKTGNIGTKGHGAPKINHPSEITAELARQVFSYDPNTGIIERLITIGGCLPGPITRVDSSGYIRTALARKQLTGHRLAWLLHYGEFPAKGLEIDHINHDKTDNRIENLRAVSKSVNQHNLYKAKKQNKIGLLGVSRVKQKFQAEIVLPGSQRKYLGVFPTPELAHEAYMAAKKQYYPGVMTP
jgi:hypothetical protein